MRNKTIIAGLVATVIFSSCGMNRPETNFEGVLMSNYGRNLNDFAVVQGAQGPLGPGKELYQVPMFQQKADPAGIAITAGDAGEFSIDPNYAYHATRGKGPQIIYEYKHLGLGEAFMDNVETNILNPAVINVYREEARKYTTDSLMNNLGTFEKSVENRLKTTFEGKYFQLEELSSNLKPPASMSRAIEMRNAAIQQAIQVKNEVETSKMLLEKARIDAQTNQVRTSGLSNANLQEQYIEMLKTTSNKVIITDGKTPVMLSQ